MLVGRDIIKGVKRGRKEQINSFPKGLTPLADVIVFWLIKIIFFWFCGEDKKILKINHLGCFSFLFFLRSFLCFFVKGPGFFPGDISLLPLALLISPSSVINNFIASISLKNNPLWVLCGDKKVIKIKLILPQESLQVQLKLEQRLVKQ